MKKIMQCIMAVAVLGLIAFNTGVDIDNNNDSALTLESLKLANANPTLDEGSGSGGPPDNRCIDNGCIPQMNDFCPYVNAQGIAETCDNWRPS